MALREVLTLNEATPQVEAPQSGDTYYLVRDVTLKTGVITSEVPDGASAILFHIQDPSYTTSGGKLFQITNNADPAFYVRFDALLHLENYALAKSTEINPQFNSITGTANSDESKFGRGAGREIIVQSPSQYSVELRATVSSTNGFAVYPNAQTGDFAAAPMHVRGGAALPGASTNVDGGDLNLVGGASATGSGNGGDVVIQGGATTAGSVGNIIMDTLPTADPTVAGALWNNSGVLTVSAG